MSVSENNIKLPSIPYYHVERVLSSAGGSAVVYWGVDLRSGYPVAIKQLYASRAKALDLQAEANRYLYLCHPNITRLVDFVVGGDQCFLIMEYVEGMNLDDYQRTRTGPLPDELAIPIFLQLLDTVAYLHDNNTLHLDLKPNNVMIKDDGSIKVLDMGISAKIRGGENNGKLRGTPSFMPPEQFERRRLGRYTDIFALGVTLYSMLTMHLPFSGKTHQEIWNNVKNGNYTPAKAYYPYVNPAFEPILRKALMSEPSERYQSCEEMAKDIRNIKNNNYKL